MNLNQLHDVFGNTKFSSALNDDANLAQLSYINLKMLRKSKLTRKPFLF